MRRVSFDRMDCSIARTLDVVGEWWTLLILRDCFLGVRRFDEFHDHLGIARNVLAQRLEKLVTEGILVRRPYQDHPLRHEYRLSEKGRELWPVLESLRRWGDRWIMGGGERAPMDLVHVRCGQSTSGVLSCAHCGVPLRLSEVHARPGPGARPFPRGSGPPTSAELRHAIGARH